MNVNELDWLRFRNPIAFKIGLSLFYPIEFQNNNNTTVHKYVLDGELL